MVLLILPFKYPKHQGRTPSMVVFRPWEWGRTCSGGCAFPCNDIGGVASSFHCL